MKPEMKASTKNDILLMSIQKNNIQEIDALKTLLTNEMYHCKSVKASSVPYYYNGCNLITVNRHSNSLRNLERNQFPYVSIRISFAHKYAAP
ncbi:hypothetical protein T11_13692 [Trichinella zimbabwensis]|uniref:Uncharacterized protein n=1 Tax=Trichinella zimbabwensis TaxID=268475 RepID=A0A0V1HNF5_9BILA|nr:hypothetical protein T11_13692 [Trichinella zimbabwensis]